MNLIIKSLNFSYQSEEVFKDLNLNFNSGILNLVSGPSGSGKTTLLNLIAGLEKPSSGLIMLDDDVQSSNDKFIEPENRNIGFIFQDFALFPHLNIKQNIEFSGNRNEELLNRLINELSIANHLSKYPHELSGGRASDWEWRGSSRAIARCFAMPGYRLETGRLAGAGHTSLGPCPSAIGGMGAAHKGGDFPHGPGCPLGHRPIVPKLSTTGSCRLGCPIPWTSHHPGYSRGLRPGWYNSCHAGAC